MKKPQQEKDLVAVLGNELIQYRVGGASSKEVLATLNLLPEGVKKPMSLLENKILFYLISKQNPFAEDGKLARIKTSVRELAELLGYDMSQHLSGRAYQSIRLAIMALRYRAIVLRFPDGSESFISWIRDNRINLEGSGDLELELEPTLTPFLIGLHGNFTKFPMEQILKLRSRYAFMLYIYIKTIAHRKGDHCVTVERLHEIMSCRNTVYVSKFSVFERDVLRPAIQEICDLTDITVNYEPIRGGRVVQSVKFSIRTSNTGPKSQLNAPPPRV